ncbi:hypothetical protein [Shinella pollutisoli]|uniref:Uncharacterized protein n=1 Tax=Shinella pollutisoli TaxID=2250594 RepID=A0ABV7DDJ8_9HYPH|nr:hypothetical protein [Shinella pollutisoli]
MSKTVILDDAERDRRLVNHINEILRHCRIGRVEPKARPAVSPRIADIMLPYPVMPAWPFDSPSPPTPMFMDKCGCKVGSVCMNAACPHAVQVTCAA